MKISTVRTHYERDTNSSEFGLEETINIIGYENILQILPCYCGNGECFYTIIYKNKENTNSKDKIKTFVINERDMNVIRDLYKSGMRYLARDHCGAVQAYDRKPIKHQYYWFGQGKIIYNNLFRSLFDFIKWEDNEPFYLGSIIDEEDE